MTNDLKELLIYCQSLKVLFVEDNYDVRMQLIKLFENFFSDMNIQEDGLAALEEFKKFKNENNKYYDLIITDLSMPKLDGVSLSKEIKSINPKQSILVISAHTEPAKIKQLEEIGVYNFLQKPVDYRLLLSTLTSLIEEIKK